MEVVPVDPVSTQPPSRDAILAALTEIVTRLAALVVLLDDEEEEVTS